MTEHRIRPRGIPFLERFSERVSTAVGSSWAFVLALGIVMVWALTGPLFSFSDTWQLVINTGTTVITFLMVFLIQRSQNKSIEAVTLKLNELVAAVEGASNRLIDIEDLSEEEMRTLHGHFRKLAEMSKKDGDVASSHSIEEAEGRHAWKRKRGQK
jgi:low affinity Fe/Cu permease